MSIKTDIENILIPWGVDTSNDLRKALISVLKQHGRKSPNDPALTFDQRLRQTPNGVVMDIVASGEYWKWIESGRKPGVKRIPAKVVGKKWQNQNNIDPRRVIASIQLKRGNGLKRSPSTLNYDKAAQQLAYIIQRSIFIHGIDPKPFVDKVMKDGRVKELKDSLSAVLKKSFKLEITLGA